MQTFRFLLIAVAILYRTIKEAFTGIDELIKGAASSQREVFTGRMAS